MQKDDIARIELLKDLRTRELDELYHWLERREFVPGADIIKQGAEANGLYLLVAGTVTVTKRTMQEKVRLTEFSAPSFFGEIGLLNHKSRTARVRAKTKVIIGYLPSLLFQNKLDQDNLTALRLSLGIGRLLAARLTQTSDLLAQTAILSKTALNQRSVSPQ